MQITKTTTIDFDEAAELERIKRAFSSAKKTPIREWLLSIHERFVAGDLDGAYACAKDAPPRDETNPLEFMNETVYDVLSEHARAGKRSVFTMTPSPKVAA
jgi:hypothetical protein